MFKNDIPAEHPPPPTSTAFCGQIFEFHQFFLADFCPVCRRELFCCCLLGPQMFWSYTNDLNLLLCVGWEPQNPRKFIQNPNLFINLSKSNQNPRKNCLTPHHTPLHHSCRLLWLFPSPEGHISWGWQPWQASFFYTNLKDLFGEVVAPPPPRPPAPTLMDGRTSRCLKLSNASKPPPPVGRTGPTPPLQKALVQEQFFPQLLTKLRPGMADTLLHKQGIDLSH